MSFVFRFLLLVSLFATLSGCAAIGAGIGAGLNHRNPVKGTFIGGSIGYGLDAISRPQGYAYGGYGYGPRCNWPWYLNGMNSQYCYGQYLMLTGGAVPLDYVQPQQQQVIIKEVIREVPAEKTSPVIIINGDINTGSSLPPRELRKAKKIKKALPSSGGVKIEGYHD